MYEVAFAIVAFKCQYFLNCLKPNSCAGYIGLWLCCMNLAGIFNYNYSCWVGLGEIEGYTTPMRLELKLSLVKHIF